ncbi:MAG: hypothetical protein FWE32_01395 [Oscillospiraceae bacterium]|nr:hypothetical protein [Oscillospiraceae bacterium]
MVNRLLSLALCALIFVSGCAGQSAALPAQPAPGQSEQPAIQPGSAVSLTEDAFVPPFRYGRSLMEGEAAVLYDRLWDFVSSPVADNAIPVGAGLREDEILHTITIFRRENPLYYWAEFTLRGRYVLVGHTLPWAEIERQRTAIEARASEILDPVIGLTPFEITLTIHDALAVIPYSSNESDENRDNLYGTLVRRSAICGGYAAAFLYLTELAGLESVFIAGNSERGISHAWNAVRLDGSWHFVDVTWNRPLGRFDSVYHSYFLIDTQTLLAQRYWDEHQFPVMPEPGDGFMDFFQRMGWSVSGELPFDAVDVLADIFYRQLVDRDVFPDSARPVYLEMRVSDSPEIYALWKDLFIRNLFEILRAVHARALDEDAGFIVSDLRNVSIDYNDHTQVLVFYPVIRAY